MNIKLYGSATIEECELAYQIVITGNEDLLDEAPEHVSRAKVRILTEVMRWEIVKVLLV